MILFAVLFHLVASITWSGEFHEHRKFPNLFSDFRTLSGSLFSRESLESRTFRSLTLGTGALYIMDDCIQREIEDKQWFKHGVLGTGQRFGNKSRLVPIVAGMYLGGRLSNDSKLENMSMDAFESMLFASGFTEMFKGFNRSLQLSSLHRPRHGGKRKHLPWPSGHAAGAFAVSTVFSQYYGRGKRKYVSWLSYGLAGLTAYSRVRQGAHWISDAFLGSAIGYFTAQNIIRMHSADSKGRDNHFFFTGTRVGYQFKF